MSSPFILHFDKEENVSAANAFPSMPGNWEGEAAESTA
jgi:hypothetical protein